jgi:hypothetical protein
MADWYPEMGSSDPVRSLDLLIQSIKCLWLELQIMETLSDLSTVRLYLLETGRPRTADHRVVHYQV